ncbi:MAG: decaprenyl-phosphate phosphoribosyltransferase [Deltaproteobacteria bacterium]|nr:decaprenyl-phosphate phosphoribosyltransferase [Deltaproteobacteria bacterium]
MGPVEDKGTGRAASATAADVLRLLRPAQWVKNLLVFAALIFSKHLFVAESAGRAAVAFAAFCLLASAGYVLNDLQDAERDRRHPAKRLRPVASGRIAAGTAGALGAGLATVALALAAALGRDFTEVALAYVALQVAYSFALKDLVILDVMAIAAGFVLRAAAGGVAIAVEVSPWLMICTFLLALFLGFSKRRHEVLLLEGNAAEHRASLREYSPYFLDQMISVVTASTVLAYAVYTVSPEVREKLHTDALHLTIPFVLYGIFRYLYLVHQREGGGNPTRELLTDRPLWVNVALWIGTAIWLLYAR